MFKKKIQFDGDRNMVVKKKRTIIIIIIIFVLLMGAFFLLLTLQKGPTIIVNNCNERYTTNSKICNNGSDYYYVDNKGRIHHLNNDNEIILNNDFDFKYISCNSHFLYATTKNKVLKLSFEGEVVNEIDTDLIDHFYNEIFGIQANEKCIICSLGSDSYIFLDLNTLNSKNINEFMEGGKNAQSENVDIYSDSSINLVHLLGDINMSKPNYSGGIIVGDKTVLLGPLGTNRIIGLSDKMCIKACSTINSTTLIDLISGQEYSIDKTDIRHITLADDRIIAFTSSYSDGWGQALSFPYYEYSNLDEGFINELPLRLHKYDTITFINPLSGEEKNIKTKSGEKVIYLDDKKAITFHKDEYHHYYIDDWKEYKSERAKEINSHSVYRFETCGEYVFVFDKNYSKLLNKIPIN